MFEQFCPKAGDANPVAENVTVKGSYLGLLTFIILVDALQPGCLTHKYTSTMTEVLGMSAVSSMQSVVDELVQQATAGMIVNGRKTKEMLIGPVLKDPPPSVSLSGTPVDRVRVTVFKLLPCWECTSRAT